MAWNQPGEDKKRPPLRGAPEPSSLQETLHRLQQRLHRLMRPGAGASSTALVLLLILAALWLASGFYQLNASERGVVLRFGRYVGTEQSGYGWHWPYPVETMTKVNVATVDSLDSRTLMMTSDQNLVDVSWSVQYRISDAMPYLFQVRDAESTLKQSSEMVLRTLVAGMSLQDVLGGEARVRLTADARERVQALLEAYHAGIALSNVNLSDVQLPDPVQMAQRDKSDAMADHDRVIAEAQAYANDILPKARSAAQRQITDAQVYASQTLASAEADADRFSQLAAAYEAAPDVTRNRIYIETMEGILSRSRKIVVDAKSGGGTMLYLPLDKLAEAVRNSAPAASAAAAAPATAAPAAPATPAATPPAAPDSGDGRGSQDDRNRDRDQR